MDMDMGLRAVLSFVDTNTDTGASGRGFEAELLA